MKLKSILLTAFASIALFAATAYGLTLILGVEGYKLPAQAVVPLAVDPTTGWLIPDSLFPSGIGSTSITNLSGISTDTTITTGTAGAVGRVFLYISIKNDSNSVSAEVAIRQGVVSGTCSGTVMYHINLSAHESLQIIPPVGISIPNGMCVDVLGGTVSLAVGRNN